MNVTFAIGTTVSTTKLLQVERSEILDHTVYSLYFGGHSTGRDLVILETDSQVSLKGRLYIIYGRVYSYL